MKPPPRSVGFNLDALGGGEAIDHLAGQYDQVQFKNGNQSVLFQRDGSAAHSSHSDVNANGVLQVVPDTGPRSVAYQQSLVTAATAAKQVNAAQTPAWERYAIPVIAGTALVIGAVFFLRR